MLQLLEKHTPGGAFDPDEVRILTGAFDQAWKTVESSGAAFSMNGHAEATRELLALRIIDMARLGERNASRLRDDALEYLARTNLKGTGV